MPVTATPVGDPTVNSYLTVVEAQAYFDTRLFTDAWDNTDQDAAVIMATRVLDSAMAGYKQFFPPGNGLPARFITGVAWSGARSSANLSKLAWPRAQMTDRNGVAIAENVIPQELKDATAELAGQLAKGDRTLDFDTVVQGITSIKAGPVGLTFASGAAAGVTSKPVPDAVWALLVPSWMLDEVYELANKAEFDVVSAGSEEGINMGRLGWW